MSSIIASSEPPAEASTPGTGRGMLSSFSMPIDCASRRAGSIVSTTTLRPCSAARSASAAETVVLPTPPEPQHTTMFVARSASKASTSSSGASSSSVVPTRGPVRGCDAFTSLSHPLPAQVRRQLVEAAQVDAVRQQRQLVRGHAEGGDPLALRVLELTALRVLSCLGEEPGHELGRRLDPAPPERGVQVLGVELPG